MTDLFNTEYLFFWGSAQKDQNVIDKSCLSQWYPAFFAIDDTGFLTSEHYMMVHKALLFNDTETLIKILKTNSPREAKRLGRLIENFNINEWLEVAFDIVVDANIAKFTQNKKLCDYLLSTGDKVIVEASPYDKIWGIGMRENDPDILDESKWKGQNLLGKALMKVRGLL